MTSVNCKFRMQKMWQPCVGNDHFGHICFSVYNSDDMIYNIAGGLVTLRVHKQPSDRYTEGKSVFCIFFIYVFPCLDCSCHGKRKLV
jgi:hypothetical protein